MSLALETVGAGASGAIVALLAATLVMSWRLPEGPARTNLQWRTGRTIAPALLPLFSTPGGGTIDYFAQAGGSLVPILPLRATA